MDIYGILAHPAGHSLSPVMHNAAFKELGMDARYDVFDVEPVDLDEFIEKFEEDAAMKGLSVSLPHKQTVIGYLDEVEEDALRIGAVNTVMKRDGKLFGYNTDWTGSNEALIQGWKQIEPDLAASECLRDKIVVVLGAGGAARAVVYGLLKLGAHVWIKNRTKEKADAIAMEFAELFDSEIHSSSMEDMSAGDILINTSSVWLQDGNWQDSAIAPYCETEYLGSFRLVMDIVYKPLMTPLLEAADLAGCALVTGEKMLLYQAADQFNLWRGKHAPAELMWGKLRGALGA
jgi:shikimate dehydrogenase